jgi:hypothetical protein
MLTFQARGHQNALFCMQIFKKISGGYTPGPPLREGATPSLHPPPARPSAVRVGASRPRLRGPKRRNLNPLRNFFLATPLRDSCLYSIGRIGHDDLHDVIVATCVRTHAYVSSKLIGMEVAANSPSLQDNFSHFSRKITPSMTSP